MQRILLGLPLVILAGAFACVGSDPDLPASTTPDAGGSARPGIGLGEIAAISAPPSRKVTAKVKVTRSGFTGPIRITAPQKPDGVDVPALEIAEGNTEGDLEITAQANAPQARSKLTLRAEANGVDPVVRDIAIVVRGKPGSLDTTGSPSGSFVTKIGNGLPAVAVDGEGRVYLLADINGCRISRHLPTGAVDPTFGTDGLLLLPQETVFRSAAGTGGSCTRIAIAGERIAVGGYEVAFGPNGPILTAAATRLRLDGSYDEAFAPASSNVVRYREATTGVEGSVMVTLTVFADGALRFVTKRSTQESGNIPYELHHFAADGARVGTAKTILLPRLDSFWRFSPAGAARMVRSDGTTLGAGGFDADGNVDTSFGPTGWKLRPSNGWNGLAEYANGIGFAGEQILGLALVDINAPQHEAFVAKVGTTDWRVPLGGSELDTSGARYKKFDHRPLFTDIAADEAGGLLVVGYDDFDFHRTGIAARFGPEGSPDQTFGTKGIAEFPNLSTSNLARVMLQSDGALILIAAEDGFTSLARIWL